MALHVFTQKEFDAIPRDEDGLKNCPSGDYTHIKNFPSKCVFGPRSVFGDGSVFGEWATFGSECVLGSLCQLGNWSQLGDYCRLGNDCYLGYDSQMGGDCQLGEDCQVGHNCRLGNNCRLGHNCRLDGDCQLGNYCYLGNNCRLGSYCDLGDCCQFGANVAFENGLVQGNVSMLKVAYIGSRKGTTYFWKHNKGIFVRCGCFAGDVEKFKAQVEKKHKNNPQHLKEYRGAIRYAEAVFGVEEPS